MKIFVPRIVLGNADMSAPMKFSDSVPEQPVREIGGTSVCERASPVSFHGHGHGHGHGQPGDEPVRTAWVNCCRMLLLVSCLAAVSCSTLSPLRNPTVEVGIDHPADIGYDVTTVAFAPPQGPCGAAIVGGVTRSLLSKGVNVLPDTTVVAGARSGIAESGVARPDTPASKSLLLGVNDTACEPEQSSSSKAVQRTRERTRTVDGKEEKYEQTYTAREITRRTRFDVGVSVRAADLGTGAVVDARAIEHFREQSASGTVDQSVPGYPPVGPLRTAATADAEEDIVRWLLPWTEPVNLVFYDAEECGMNAAYSHLLRGDIGFALDAALSGIARCGDDEGAETLFRAAARYNAGIVYFIDGDHDSALRMLRAARMIDPENASIARAVEHVLRARELEAEVRRIHGGGDVGEADNDGQSDGDPSNGSL